MSLAFWDCYRFRIRAMVLRAIVSYQVFMSWLSRCVWVMLEPQNELLLISPYIWAYMEKPLSFGWLNHLVISWDSSISEVECGTIWTPVSEACSYLSRSCIVCFISLICLNFCSRVLWVCDPLSYELRRVAVELSKCLSLFHISIVRL